MKKNLVVLPILIFSLLQVSFVEARTPINPQHPSAGRSTLQLKKYMSHFGSLVSGMEIIRYKEKKTDWEAINITLTDMEKTLQDMQKADTNKAYQAFTNSLEKNLKNVRRFYEKRDLKMYEAFDQLTQTCFQCHAAHRPSDFLIPKKKDPRVSSQTSFLTPWIR